MSAEEWRDCIGFPGYQVSDLGRVRSTLRWRGSCGPRIMKQRRTNGYQYVGLAVAGRSLHQNWRVHRLVTEAFLGQRPDGLVTRHLNGDKSDNRLVNLAYGTPSENAFDAVRLGEHGFSSRSHCKNGHEFTSENTRVSGTTRLCRECDRAKSLRHKLRQSSGTA